MSEVMGKSELSGCHVRHKYLITDRQGWSMVILVEVVTGSTPSHSNPRNDSSGSSLRISRGCICFLL